MELETSKVKSRVTPSLFLSVCAEYPLLDRGRLKGLCDPELYYIRRFGRRRQPRVLFIIAIISRDESGRAGDEGGNPQKRVLFPPS